MGETFERRGGSGHGIRYDPVKFAPKDDATQCAKVGVLELAKQLGGSVQVTA